MSNFQEMQSILYTIYVPLLPNWEEIDAWWFELDKVDLIQITWRWDTAGLTLTIDSRTDDEEPVFSVSENSTDVILNKSFWVTQRKQRFRWINNTGGWVNNVSFEVKAKYWTWLWAQIDNSSWWAQSSNIEQVWWQSVPTLWSQKILPTWLYNWDGDFLDLRTNMFWNLLVSLDNQKDAFGRLKVAEPETLWDNSLTSETSNNLFWSELVQWSATSDYVRLTSSIDMTTSTSGDYVVRQSKQRFKYQPWKSHEFLMTWLLTDETNVRKRIWLVDYDNIDLVTPDNNPQNWIFFENNWGVYSWNIANNWVITETVTQAQWNIDVCDWTWRSGFLFNPNFTNIYQWQLEWLWVWVVLVGFVSSMGEIIYCHGFEHASIPWFTDVYMRTANLPVAYEITQTWAGSGTLKQICSTVTSWWWHNPKWLFRTVSNDTDVPVNSANFEALIGIRLKPEEFEYDIIIKSISLLVESSWDSEWKLVFNPTITWTVTWVDEVNSNIQVAKSWWALEVTDTWLEITGWYVSSDSDAESPAVDNSLRLGKGLDNSLDEIWLIAAPLTGTEDFRWAINYITSL